MRLFPGRFDLGQPSDLDGEIVYSLCKLCQMFRPFCSVLLSSGDKTS